MDKTAKLGLNLPNESDLVNPEDFNASLRVIEEYVTSLTQVCSATTPGALATTKTWKTVSFGAIVKSGYAFSLSGGGVKLSEGGFAMCDVHVLVTGMATDDAIGVHIAKNGTTMWQYSSATATNGDWLTVDQTSKLIPVAKNDVLTVKIATRDTNQGALDRDASWLNVHLYKNLNF